MKLSELKGKPVVDLATARKVGVVDDALVNPSQQKIEGLLIKTERRAPEYAVSTEHVRGIGKDAVTIDEPNSLRTLDQAPNLTGLLHLSSMIHSRVVTQSGKVIGSISDIAFDPASGMLQNLEYNEGGLGALLGRHRTLNPSDMIGVGQGIVTVTDNVRPPKAA